MNKLCKKLIRIILVGVFTLISQQVFGCQCEGISTIQDSFADANSVFVGKVVSSKNDSTRSYNFEIIESFKGNKSTNIEVANPQNMCEPGFEIGETYLIYAFGDTEKGLYTNSFCSRTGELINERGQIDFLREIASGKPVSQIYGSIFLKDLDFKENKFYARPLDGIEIIVENENKSFKTITDSKGLFRFNKIPKGVYQVKAKYSDKYELSGYPSETTIVVFDSGKVVNTFDRVLDKEIIKKEETAAFYYQRINTGEYVDFNLKWNTSVRGKIFDLDGIALNGVNVQLVPIKSNSSKLNIDSHNNSDSDYYLFGFAPGDYYLVAELNAPLKEKIFYYPQADTKEKSTVINLGEKQKLDFDFIVPVRNSILQGNISFEYEELATPDVKVFLTDSETKIDLDKPKYEKINDFKIYYEGSMDMKSNFFIKGFVGAEYWLHVLATYQSIENNKVIEKHLEVKPIRIRLEKENKPIEVLISKGE